MKTRSIGTTCVAIAMVVMAASACSFLNRSTPTSTFKAFFEASKKKDVPEMKKHLSKGTLEMFDKLAKAQNKTADDMLKDVDKDSKDEKLPETRNEKINGDTATLEVKNDKSEKWDTLPFVKEKDEWKIAMDKFIEDMMKGFSDKLEEKSK